MATKKVKIKVTKKKINIKKIIIAIIVILLLVFGVVYFIHMPVKNIYIVGNSILNDKVIIEEAKLDDYPPYVNTYFLNSKDNLLKDDYIKM